MLDFINSPTSLAILVSGIVFTIFGHGLGFLWGYKWYSRLLIDSLTKEGYVRYRILDNGEIELLKINED